MARCKEWIGVLNQKYPESLAEDWDNIGLVIGTVEQEVKKILICLDVTLETIEEAILEGVDLIISHHPLFIEPIKKIGQDDILGIKIERLIQHRIALYVMHTNVDIAKEGLNDYLAKILGFKKSVPLDSKYPLRLCSYAKEMSTDLFLYNLMEKLNLKSITVVNKKEKIKKIALCTGSGKSFLEDILKTDVDAYITGDITYHAALDGIENGMMLIDAGHYNTEIIFIDLLYDFLKKTAQKLDAEIVKAQRNGPIFKNFV